MQVVALMIRRNRSLAASTVVARLLLTAAMTVLLAVTGARAQSEPPLQAPDQLIRSVAGEVLRTLRDDHGALRAGGQAAMAQLIRREIAPYFDFELMTRLALGRNWRLATPEQRAALVQAFSALLIRTYASAFSVANAGISVEVEPLGVSPGDTDVQVKTRIRLSGGQPPVAVDYSLYKSGSAWRVYDLSVSGVDLVATYRGVFDEAIRNGGIEGLLASLEMRSSQHVERARPDRVPARP